MTRKLTEAVAFDALVPPQDVGTAPVTSGYLDCTHAGRIVLLAKAGAVTAGKVLTVQARQAKDAAGTGAKELGVAATAAGVGGASPPDVEVEFVPEDLDGKNGFTHVGVTLSIDEAAKLGAAYLARGNRRYGP
ncbi:MAG: hypothetical protein HUU06_11440 [Planctomycetaceae bacterium]|nr:hypothetical protein [Planctomycetota bacterium]MCK6530871.1 hypothetical protein [Myxococcota bacterium]NUN53383.1 hypothetical protein [Planctomycetaceae bacterium]